MQITRISITEEKVLDPAYDNLRIGRIEVYVKNKRYPYEAGKIRISDNPLLFDELKEILENIY